MARTKTAVPWTFRQGDILLRAVPDIPAEATAHQRPTEQGRVILAYGEVTGHAHALDAATVTAYGPSDDAFWLSVEQPGQAVLRHEEHTTVTIPKEVKFVQVIRQREYSEAGERRVAD